MNAILVPSGRPVDVLSIVRFGVEQRRGIRTFSAGLCECYWPLYLPLIRGSSVSGNAHIPSFGIQANDALLLTGGARFSFLMVLNYGGWPYFQIGIRVIPSTPRRQRKGPGQASAASAITVPAWRQPGSTLEILDLWHLHAGQGKRNPGGQRCAAHRRILNRPSGCRSSATPAKWPDAIDLGLGPLCRGSERHQHHHPLRWHPWASRLRSARRSTCRSGWSSRLTGAIIHLPGRWPASVPLGVRERELLRWIGEDANPIDPASTMKSMTRHPSTSTDSW